MEPSAPDPARRRRLPAVDVWTPRRVRYPHAPATKDPLNDGPSGGEDLAALRERIEAAPWVEQVQLAATVRLGPHRLLVVVRIVPSEDVRAGSAERLLELVHALRQDLLSLRTVTDAEITVLPPRQSSESPLAAGERRPPRAP